MMQAEDKQISLTDPDARSMAGQQRTLEQVRAKSAHPPVANIAVQLLHVRLVPEGDMKARLCCPAG
jgi:hypothetical protein